MANTMYLIVDLATTSFTTACPMRVDNIRCRNKSSCDRVRDGEGGRDPDAGRKSIDLRNVVLQDAASGAAWEDVKSQVERLMTLRLCLKHQSIKHEAVRCTLDLLLQEFKAFQPKVITTEKQAPPMRIPSQPTANSIYSLPRPPIKQEYGQQAHTTSKTQPRGPPKVIKTEEQALPMKILPKPTTNDIYSLPNPKPKQEYDQQAHTPSKPQPRSPVTPPFSPKHVVSKKTFQFSCPVAPKAGLTGAQQPTLIKPTNGEGSHTFDFSFGLPQVQGNPTPPSTPEKAKIKDTIPKESICNGTTFKDTVTQYTTPKGASYETFLPEDTTKKPAKSEITTPATPCRSKSPLACKTIHHFASYPHAETRSSVLDELLDNFEALEIRNDELKNEKAKLKDENAKLNDENTILRARCEAFEASEAFKTLESLKLSQE